MLSPFCRSAAFICISGIISACTRINIEDRLATSADSLLLISAAYAVPQEDEDDSSLYLDLLLHLTHSTPSDKWPVYVPQPPEGALLPYNRILAYNISTIDSGDILQQEIINKLKEETIKWRQADTVPGLLPALHYVAVSTQNSPGTSGKYRQRMPAAQIEQMITLAYQHHMLLFLDVQVGLSTLQEELPRLETYLRLRETHLGIDPEYSMKRGEVPFRHIGTFDAADINYAITFLAGIVKKYQLPPKILVIHRHSQAMLTNYDNIKKVPEVQVVINMNSSGSPEEKTDNYNNVIAGEPVQYTGFRLFHKMEAKPVKRVMRPEEIVALYPSPVYIQYQ